MGSRVWGDEPNCKVTNQCCYRQDLRAIGGCCKGPPSSTENCPSNTLSSRGFAVLAACWSSSRPAGRPGMARGCHNKEKKKKLGVSNTPYDGGRWVTDGGWWVTDGGWWVTDGGWWVTDGGWWVTDGGWWVTDGGWWVADGGWWVATKHQRVAALVKKKKG